MPQNRCALCGGALCRRLVKRCRLVLRFCVCDRRKFDVLLFLPAPLDRLTPNEALPHTPQGTLSLDPASPLTPGLSLRFISRYARCCLLLYACSALLIPHFSFLIPHSSFLTPHSSFLTPHSSFLTPHSSFLTPHSSLKSLYRLTKPL